jgi:Flp pilus assembly pilin Flp
MRSLIRHFLRDESGSVVVGDWVFVATILVLGAVAGVAVLHQSRPDGSEDPAAAVQSVQAPHPPAIVADRP